MNLDPMRDKWTAFNWNVIEVDGHKVEGYWRAHQIPILDVADNPSHLAMLEAWMRSYQPEQLFDENGSVDGSFEAAAFPSGIARGEEAQFEGKYFTPVGDSLSWDAIPRCGNSDEAVYGARKRGTLSLKRRRILRLKKFKTR